MMHARLKSKIAFLCLLLAAWFVVLVEAAPKLSLSDSSYEMGEPIIVSFSGATKNSKDWIGLFKKGRKPNRNNAGTWFYVDGTTVGYAGLASGSLSFPESVLSKALVIDGAHDGCFQTGSTYIHLNPALAGKLREFRERLGAACDDEPSLK
jgi:hypothetical protein